MFEISMFHCNKLWASGYYNHAMDGRIKCTQKRKNKTQYMIVFDHFLKVGTGEKSLLRLPQL